MNKIATAWNNNAIRELLLSLIDADERITFVNSYESKYEAAEIICGFIDDAKYFAGKIDGDDQIAAYSILLEVIDKALNAINEEEGGVFYRIIKHIGTKTREVL